MNITKLMNRPVQLEFPFVEDNSTYCMSCGGKMRHNVPRLGPAGGFVHVSNGDFLCEPREPTTFKNQYIKEDSCSGWNEFFNGNFWNLV